MKRKGPHRNLEKQRFWRYAVGQWRRSGQSVRDYCRANALSEPSFYAWRRELRQRGRTSQATPKAPREAASFLPVQVVAAANPFAAAAESGRPLGGGVEIVLQRQRTVRVQAGFDCQTLADVLAVLEA